MGSKNRNRPRQLAASQSQENPVSDNSEQQASGASPESTPVLLGSDRPYAYVQIGDGEAQLGALVALAQVASGLTPEQWNAASAEERDGWIDSIIDNERQLVAEGKTPNVQILPIERLDESAPQTIATGVQDQSSADSPAAEVVDSPASSASEVITDPTPSAPAPAPTAAPAPAPTPAPLPVAVVVAPESNPDAVPPVPQGLSSLASSSLQLVAEYIPAMRPKRPITKQDLVRQQSNLNRAILTVINKLEQDEFAICWKWLLEQFLGYRNGVFGERHVYRGFEDLPMAEGERRVFSRLINLMIVTADPRGRKLALQQVSLVKSLETGITEPGRQRMHAFYGV